MVRRKGKKRTISVSISEKVYQRVMKHRELTGMPVDWIIERALINYFDLERGEK